MGDIEKILNRAGYKTVSGFKAVKSAIARVGKGQPKKPLCSGFRVFPDGTKCEGCEDCKFTK